MVASDAPLGPPDSLKELEYGDGAAALLIGDSEVAVTVEGSYSITSEFLDTWRLPGDRIRSGVGGPIHSGRGIYAASSPGSFRAFKEVQP